MTSLHSSTTNTLNIDQHDATALLDYMEVKMTKTSDWP